MCCDQSSPRHKERSKLTIGTERSVRFAPAEGLHSKFPGFSTTVHVVHYCSSLPLLTFYTSFNTAAQLSIFILLKTSSPIELTSHVSNQVPQMTVTIRCISMCANDILHELGKEL